MPLLARRQSTNSLDPDCLLWVMAVEANGGSVSSFRKIVVSNFIRAEKAAGSWFLTDDYWCFWAENEIQALTSIKQRRLTTAVNSPVFTTDRYYSTDGVASYLDTNFVPSTHAIVGKANFARFGVYISDNNSSSTTAHVAGATALSSRALRIRPRTSASRASVEIITGNTPSSHTLPADITAGYLSGSRDAANVANYYVYKNAILMSVVSNPLSFGSALTDVSIFVGGHNSGGVLTGPRLSSVGFMVFGGVLSSGQELAHYNNIQAWATAVGAQV